MYAREETITPEIAEAYLRRNLRNRDVRHSKVEEYAMDMKAGKWQLTPQGISFYQNGDLADGQHRLLAVIEAGVPVKFWVTYDVPNDSNIYDYGAKRKPHDILKLSGTEASTTTVALSRFLFNVANVKMPTIQMLNDFVSDNLELISLADICTRHGVSSKYNIVRKSSCIAAAYCALSCGVQPEVVDRFFVCVNSGEYDLGKGESASNFLRNWIYRNYTGKTSMNRREAFYQTCYALSDFDSHINRKLEYKITANVPYWKFVKREVISRYIGEYKLS